MKHLNILPGVLLCAMLFTAGAHAQTVATPADASAALAKQPLTFVENRGQWHPNARFLARMNGLDLWVTDGELIYDLYQVNKNASGDATVRSGHVVRMQFLGANPDASASGIDALPGTFNYFMGKDKSHWATGVRRYQEARINSLYPGVDALLYTDNGAPRYDLVVAPGADPSAIRIAYKGAEAIHLERDGSLTISTSKGKVTQHGLLAYQMVNGKKRPISCSFTMDHAGSVGFELGTYDRKALLVIDPIIYSTYYGGSNWDEARAIVVDSTTQNIRIYMAGFTFSANFPTAPGSYQTTYAGDGGGTPPGGDAFVAKLDPRQAPPAQLMWATYLGSDDDEAATDMAVDNSGNVYITGVSGTEFPTTGTVVPVGGRGVFVTKLSSVGSTLLYSTYVADSSATPVSKMTLDAANRAHVTGSTISKAYPTTNNALQRTLGGGSDAFVSVLEANGTSLAYATYLGGNANDGGTAIAINSFGEIHMAGTTESANFPLRKNLAFDTTYNGGTDLFVARLDRNQSNDLQLLFSSYYGGTGYDEPTDLAIDPFGDIVVVGTTTSTNFPIKNSLRAFTPGGTATVGDAFVLKINSAVTAPTQIIYGTYLGGAGADMATGIITDKPGNAYVVGWTGSSTFPITNNGIDTSFGGDSSDVFVTKFSKTGGLMYGTYLGGNAGDKGYAIAMGRDENLFVAGHTLSSNFPLSTTPFQGTLGSSNRPDVFLTQFRILEITSPRGGESLCAGTTHTITWTGSPNTNYDVYVSSNGGVTYNPLAFNVTQTSYPWIIPMEYPAGDRYRVKIVLSTGGEYDISDSNFTINSKPIVTRNPQNVIQVEGGSVSFTADATGTPTPTVQWQFNTGAGWTTIPGETQKTLSLQNITAAQKGTQYRAVFTNSCGSVNTEPATLDVSAILVLSPNGGEQVCAGTTQSITWSAQSTAGPFDIFISSNAGQDYGVLATGVTGTSYNWAVPSNLFGTNFRIQVRITNAQASDASDANFTVSSPAVVLRSPGNVTATVGSTASFVSEGNGFPFPAVRWEINTGAGWAPVDGVTVPVLAVPSVQMSQTGHRYRAIFTNACGSDTTTEAVLTVAPVGGVDMESGAQALRLAVAPNPLVGDGQIRFTLPRAARVELTITDLQGRVVARPLGTMLGAGDHNIPFDAAGLPSGTYVVSIAAGADHGMIKMTIAR